MQICKFANLQLLPPILRLQLTFEERENRACELGDALTRRLLEEHLSVDELAD